MPLSNDEPSQGASTSRGPRGAEPRPDEVIVDQLDNYRLLLQKEHDQFRTVIQEQLNLNKRVDPSALQEPFEDIYDRLAANTPEDCIGTTEIPYHIVATDPRQKPYLDAYKDARQELMDLVQKKVVSIQIQGYFDSLCRIHFELQHPGERDSTELLESLKHALDQQSVREYVAGCGTLAPYETVRAHPEFKDNINRLKRFHQDLLKIIDGTNVAIPSLADSSFPSLTTEDYAPSVQSRSLRSALSFGLTIKPISQNNSVDMPQLLPGSSERGKIMPELPQEKINEIVERILQYNDSLRSMRNEANGPNPVIKHLRDRLSDDLPDLTPEKVASRSKVASGTIKATPGLEEFFQRYERLHEATECELRRVTDMSSYAQRATDELFNPSVSRITPVTDGLKEMQTRVSIDYDYYMLQQNAGQYLSLHSQTKQSQGVASFRR